MSTETTATVRVTRRFNASAERVFDAWLDANRAATFLFATAAGRMVRADIDARVGGSFCLSSAGMARISSTPGPTSRSIALADWCSAFRYRNTQPPRPV